MYQWYWRADICYAYLADVHAQDIPDELDYPDGIRWFTRGWTLQELLAPSVVEFYNQDWILLGTKWRLANFIQGVTSIDRRYLKHRDEIKDASVATKFSWASKRSTTRVEDMAYCLLGLVDVNMPMLYGEGTKAFYRLQLELIKKTNEHSIFAWQNDEPRLWYNFGTEEPGRGDLLSPSPQFFAGSAGIFTCGEIVDAEHEMTNRGLRMRLPCIRSVHGEYIAVLSCMKESRKYDGYIGIRLSSLGHGRFRRIAASKMTYVSKQDAENATVDTIYIDAVDQSPSPDVIPDYQIRVYSPDTGSSIYQLADVMTDDPWGSYFRLLPGTLVGAMTVTPLPLRKFEFGGLLFCSNRGREENFLAVFGQHLGRLWLGIQEEIDVSRLKNVMHEVIKRRTLDQRYYLHDSAEVELMQKYTEAQFMGDYTEVRLKDATVISIKAKLKRAGEALSWDLNIDVSMAQA